MADEQINNPDIEDGEGNFDLEPSRRLLTRSKALNALIIIAIVGFLATVITFVAYRYGVFDVYIRQQFTAKLSEMGISFKAKEFRVIVDPFDPLKLRLKDAEFTNKVTGDPLFNIATVELDLGAQNLFGWQKRGEIDIAKTVIDGAEVLVKFDANGRSNFADLKLIEDEKGSAVNFKYDSGTFLVTNSVVHIGDLTRSISANANNLEISLKPVNEAAGKYGFEITSSRSDFAYEGRRVDDISLTAIGIADDKGADITTLDLKTPVGYASLKGNIVDWASPKYDFEITSSLNLAQAGDIISRGSALTGEAAFNGRLTGQAETYKIDGTVGSGSLRAGGIYLKGTNITGTVAGTNTNYEANGTAIAEMLTFEDFRVDLLKAIGNIRGTGTDFRWWGELQAAAASSKDLSIGGLYLSDAVAEMKDRELRATAGNGRAKRFAIGDMEFSDFQTRGIRFGLNGDNIDLSAPGATARSFVTPDFRLDGVTGKDLKVKRRPGTTSVDLGALRSDSAQIKGNKLKNVTADGFTLTDVPRSTNMTARNLRADGLDIDGTRVTGIETPLATVDVAGGTAVIYSDKLRVAKIDTGAAVLGSLNIGGVRLTIRQGRVEARSNDIDAGKIALSKTKTLPEGGNLENVKFAKPVFLIEPSGRYRASADMSLGGGAIGSIALGAAKAKVDVNNDRVALNELAADIMDGSLAGTAIIALNNRSRSTLKGDFTNLDIGKLIALQGGTVTPIEGQTTGNIDLSFNGTELKNASGTLNATISANAGTAERGLIPVNGQVRLTASSGLFNVDEADLNTGNSKLTATGRFDLRDNNSDLTVALRSTDANEIERLVRVLGITTAVEQLDSLQATLAGNLTFDGTVSGNLYDPNVDGRASLDSLSLRGKDLGSVGTDIKATPLGVDLTNGKLTARDGGTALFAVNIPYGGTNNTNVKATLTNVNAGNLLAALPIELPERIRDLSGNTSGTVDISGLPNNAQGEINLAAAKGVIAGQAFDDLKVKAVFSGTQINVEQADMRVGAGSLGVKGNYDRATTAFNFDLTGTAVPLPLALALLPKNDSIPVITGDVDMTVKATGIADRTSSYAIDFTGRAANVQVDQQALGEVTFKGQTAGQLLTADLTATFDGRPQVIAATLNFGNDDMPFTAATDFNQSPLAPFLAFIPQLKTIRITGTGTGRVDFGGKLSPEIDGKRVISAAALSGRANFSQLSLQIQDTPLSAAEPVIIRFDPREIVVEKARFAGGGSNMTIAGTKALTEDGSNNLSVDGRVNLNLLNLFTKDTFFSGLADTSIRFLGPNKTARVSGTANMVNASVATFVGSDRFSAERVQARIIFTSDRVEVEEASGFLGGGRFTGSGGGTLDGLAISAFRFSMSGNNVTVPLPKDFSTTGDAQLEITGTRERVGASMELRIGGRVYARRSLYSKDIDLANLVGNRRDATLAGGSSGGRPIIFDDLVIEGRDALVVKNNIADLTASVSLVLSGDASNPRVSGRVTANSGTIFFRKDRYVVQRAVLEFPPETNIDPIINLQAESEIAGYQVFVNLSGPLKDSEQLSATVRSSPALPQADVVSLITTGSLTNSAGGIPTFAQTGINTAAEILTDTIINTPARRATDRLFGLNVFEIDPLISGQQANPGARLTVGRQINNNLRVTYSTNLSQDQNQVLALEYRVSNRLSVVAQYEQRSLTNVTRNRDNFSFEVRFRKRF